MWWGSMFITKKLIRLRTYTSFFESPHLVKPIHIPYSYSCKPAYRPILRFRFLNLNAVAHIIHPCLVYQFPPPSFKQTTLVFIRGRLDMFSLSSSEWNILNSGLSGNKSWITTTTMKVPIQQCHCSWVYSSLQLVPLFRNIKIHGSTCQPFLQKQVWNQLTSLTSTSATFVDSWVIYIFHDFCLCLGTPRGKRASRIYSWPSPSCESSEIGYSKSTDSKVSAFITDSIRTKRANKFWKALRCSWQGSLCLPPIGLRSSILNG